MDTLTFATTASDADAARALLLFESLRSFGGELADSPGLLLLPTPPDALTPVTRERLARLNVNQVKYHLTEGAARFPLA